MGCGRRPPRSHGATAPTDLDTVWRRRQVLKGEAFNEMADVYSFGVIMWELLSRKKPWKGLSQVGGCMQHAGHRRGSELYWVVVHATC
jgi:hypothetical protein